LALLAAAVAPAPGAAHDYWLELTAFRPAVGERVGVRHLVGERRAGEEVPRVGPRIVRFDRVGPDGAEPVTGRDGLSPAGWTAAPEPGLHWVAFESTASTVELAPGLFARYLADEGLEAIAAERERRGEAAALAREAYSRDAKAALCVAETSAAAVTQPVPLGLELELTPLDDPCALLAGARARFELRFRGVPLAGALVRALGPGGEASSAARSDRRGRVELRLDRPGVWLVKSVHMSRAAEIPEIDWRSWWASLTLEVVP
jgi:hypothetical protein